MKRRLGKMEMQFLAYTQMRRLTTVRTGDMQEALALSPSQERELLSRLYKAGMIARVRRGLYLVPGYLPPGGEWTPDEATALNTLMQEAGGRYQICGLNAINRYGYDEQVPARVYAYNDKVSGERTIGVITLDLIKVDKKRLGDTERVRTWDGQTVFYSSRVRTLVDAVYDWARFGTLPRAYRWIRKDLKAGRIDPEALVKCTLRFGDVGTIRRMGVLLEGEGVDEGLLERLEKAMRPTSATIPFSPGKPKRGKADRRWGVLMNG
jgi:predicted transcriptional regulator of viral defense system